MQNNIVVQEKENIVAGIIGAFLFALAGGLLWFLLYQVGFLAGISGIVAVVCAIKGYAVFAKKESLKGIIISVFVSVIVILIAWYICLSMDVYQAYQEWYNAGEVDFTLTFAESVRCAYIFLADGEILGSYLLDLGIGLALCGFGAYRSIANAITRVKEKKENTPEGE